MDVLEFRMANRLAAREIVKAIQEEYPKYDKHLNSKVERPEQYGICLLPAACRVLSKAFPEARNGPVRDYHRLKHRVSCRLEKEEYERLQRALKEAGQTMQVGLRRIIVEYLDRNGR